MKLFQVDAFSAVPFKGNPAGVCLLEKPMEDDWMKNVAMEMNLSETAFLLPEGDGWRLRWFTPKKEVRLCGHATLASAHILWQTKILAAGEEARFYTLSGLLTASKNRDWITLNFPARQIIPAELPEGLSLALGNPSMVFAGCNEDRYLIELENEAQLRDLQPDFTLLGKLPVRALIVTSRASAPYDFISRYFAPAVGVNEDPVTGSSHTYLTPYWAAKLNRQEMSAYQASARGGELRVQIDGERVLISGQAVTFFAAELK
jgi:PhzF family phenazine biosynthesis protein